MTTAVIYTNGSQECERIASLLRSMGGEFLEYNLNEHFTQRAFGSGATYPQVAIGAKHLGNLKETLHHMKERGMI
jgi:hypothetical protein